LTLLFQIFIVSTVLALTVAEVDVLSDAGVVNIDILAVVDTDPDFLNDADKLGLGSLLPGPSFGSTALIPLNLYTSILCCFCGLD
jgi:hypothetical protein